MEERSPEITLPCRDVVAIDPKPRDRERLAERYNRPDLVRRSAGISDIPRAAESGDNANVHSGLTFAQGETAILGERELPPLPAGGTALLTLEPDGRVEVTVKPDPVPLFDWRTTWEVGGMYGKGTAGDTRARAWAAVEPIRFGGFHLRGEIGADVRAGLTDGYAMVGVVWRSK
jgi:hypothetical protein